MRLEELEQIKKCQQCQKCFFYQACLETYGIDGLSGDVNCKSNGGRKNGNDNKD